MMKSRGQPKAGGHIVHPSCQCRALGLILLPTLSSVHTRVQVDAAIYKLHTRRCCTLEFHQTNDSIVISGDKKGGIAIWDFDRVGVNQSAL